MSNGTNAVAALIAVYDDGGTFMGASDIRAHLATVGFDVSPATATHIDRVARRQLLNENKQVLDPTWENNWSRTRLASQEEMERSRQRSVRYLRTFAANLAQKLAVDAAQRGASPEAVQNDALLQASIQFIQSLADYSFEE